MKLIPYKVDENGQAQIPKGSIINGLSYKICGKNHCCKELGDRKNQRQISVNVEDPDLTQPLETRDFEIVLFEDPIVENDTLKLVGSITDCLKVYEKI